MTEDKKNQATANRFIEYGREYYYAGRHVEAKKCFSYAIKMDPENAAALNGFSTVLCDLNNGEWTEEAVDALLKSLKANPNNHKVWNNLGDYYYLRGEFDESIKYFEKAVELNINYPLGFVNLALAYRNTNRGDDAFKALQKAIILDPNDPWAFYQLGLTYIFRGMRFECLDDLEKGREIFNSMEEREMNVGDLPVEKMGRLLDTFLTMKVNVQQIERLLAENIQYFGDERDREVFGHMIN